ncbi:MAG: sodium/solute symporter [Bacteroidota bacterium]
MLTSADYSVILVYIGILVILSIVAKRMVKNVEDYFSGGKRVPWWLAAISHHMSGYSAYVFVVLAPLAYKSGFTAWMFYSPGLFIAMVIGAWVWAPRWAKMKILTPIEFLEKRYNNVVRQLFAWSGIGLKFIDEGVKLYALSVVIYVVTGWPLPEIIIGVGIVTVLYLFFGGLWATILTDFMQFLVQFAITLVIIPFVFKLTGGVGGMVEQMRPESRIFFDAEITPWFLVVYFFVMLLLYNGGTWGLAQRFYSIGKPKDAKKAALLSASLFLIYPLAVFIPIWASPSIVGAVANSEHIYIEVAQKILSSISPGLMGLFVASMFAATMSMIDSDLNSLAAVFTKDIYQRNFRPNSSDKMLLRVGMIATAVFGFFTIAFALITIEAESALSLVIEWYSAISGPIVLPTMLGIVFIKPTWRGAIFSWVAGFAAFIFFKYGIPAIWGIETKYALYVGMELLVSFTVFMLDGKLSRRSKEKEAEVQEFFEQFDELNK